MATQPVMQRPHALGVHAEPTHKQLKRGVLTLPDVIFQSVVCQAPGAAVALNFSFAVLFAGSAFPLSMLIALIACLFLVNTLTEFSKHLSSSAGFGTYAARGLGPRYGFFTSWVALFYGYLFPAAVVVLVAQLIQNELAAYLHITVAWQLWNALLVGLVWLFAYTGIKRSTRIAIIAGSLEVCVFAALAVALIARAGSHNTLVVFTPGAPGLGGVAWGLVWGFLSFTGFESVASLAEETAQPKRNVGRAGVLALVAVGLFYVLLAYAGVVGWGLNKLGGFAADSFPYGTLATALWAPFGVMIILAVINSSFACSLAALNFAARYFYSLGRLHALPPALGRVHPRFGTPTVSISTMAILTLVFSEGLGTWWGPSLAFGFLATAFTFGWIAMYIATNIALPFYYRREHPASFSPIKHIVLPGLGTLALVPAIVAPVLPLAGAVPWQTIATVPVTLAWVAIGIVVALRMSPRLAERLVRIGDDQEVKPVIDTLAPEREGGIVPGFAR